MWGYGGLEDIRKRYRELVVTEHPDKRQDANASARFAEITAAYRDLMDPKREEGLEDMQWDLEAEFPEQEGDADSLVVLIAIVLWVLIFGVLAASQDFLSWDSCSRQWDWWCYLKGG
ncbi:unnamed protein product [Effrenium voratum]|nr:unnamed protein product [Effrenium voratum]